jgi:hypothetical protein
VPGLDVSRLAPSDCAAALRSFPRRFRAAVTSLDEDERPDDLAHRVGPDGRSAFDHVDHAARSIALIGGALREVLTRPEPVLPAAVIDDGAREWAVAGDGSLEAALDFLTVECLALADLIDETHGDAWSRKATVAGDGTVTAIDLAREAVKTGAEHLRAAERAMQAARHH